MDKVSLKIAISPRDYRFITHLLPHQLKVWAGQVDEILIVFDYHGYDTSSYTELIGRIHAFIDELQQQYPKIRLIEVDYSENAQKLISKAYFNNKKVPAKTHRYGPYYSYFYGLYMTSHDYVLNIDSDLFFGGHNPDWIQEAIGLMKSDDKLITCTPFPGPPTADGKLISQSGQADDSPLRKIRFDSFSTRIFFIYKPSFIKELCPIPVKIAELPVIARALIRKRPVYALPEDILTETVRRKGLYRVDFLGSGDGLWTLHPPFRNEAFFKKLHELVNRVEQNDIPDGQRGYYDINESMVDWGDALAELKNASLKLKLLRSIGIRSN